MAKILTAFKSLLSTNQVGQTEKVSHTTIFSRGENSGSKLFLSLKNIFSRTEKSQAKAVVAQAVPEATTGSIKADHKKLDHLEPDPRSRVRQVYRQLLIDPSQESQPGKVSHEAIVSRFDTVISKILGKKITGDGEVKRTLEELNDLKTFVNQNKKMNDSSKNQLLGDLNSLINMASEDKISNKNIAE